MLVCFVLTLTSMFHPQMALLGFFNNYFGLTMDGFCPTFPTSDPKLTGPVNERTGHGHKTKTVHNYFGHVGASFQHIRVRLDSYPALYPRREKNVWGELESNPGKHLTNKKVILFEQL